MQPLLLSWLTNSTLVQLMEALEKTKSYLEADEKGLTDNRSVLASTDAEVKAVKEQLAKLQGEHDTQTLEIRKLCVDLGGKDAQIEAFGIKLAKQLKLQEELNAVAKESRRLRDTLAAEFAGFRDKTQSDLDASVAEIDALRLKIKEVRKCVCGVA